MKTEAIPTEIEIISALKKLKNRETLGKDEISVERLRCLLDLVSKPRSNCLARFG